MPLFIAVLCIAAAGGGWYACEMINHPKDPTQLSDISGTLEQSGTLTYTGSPLTPTVSGLSTVGDKELSLKYSLTQNGEYGPMPTITEPGTVTVYYKASAADHNPKEGSFTVTVNRADITGTLVQNGFLWYNGTLQIPSVTGLSTVDGSDITVTYSSTENGEFSDEPFMGEVGSVTVYYNATATNHNPKNGCLTVTLKETYSIEVFNGTESVTTPGFHVDTFPKIYTTKTVGSSTITISTEPYVCTLPEKVGLYLIEGVPDTSGSILVTANIINAGITGAYASGAVVTVPLNDAADPPIMRLVFGITDAGYDGLYQLTLNIPYADDLVVENKDIMSKIEHLYDILQSVEISLTLAYSDY